MSSAADAPIDLRPTAGSSGPDAARAAAGGERLRAAFHEACARENVQGRLVGPPERMAFVFETQETAPPARILAAFLNELEARGVQAGPEIAAGAALDGARMAAAVRALKDAVRRVRALLVEYNSYLSAGLPWVFPRADERLRARGLCTYRYPARAAVEVSPAGAAIRIAFAPGSLGEVTSSGFYVPTSVRGDFTATIRYHVRRWRPGPVHSCLALFAQDEPSLVRFYAQRFTEAGAPDRALVQANLNDVWSPPVAVTGDRGALRVQRRDDTLSSWHDDGRGWLRLGETALAARPDLFVGAKIWSGGECGGLEADLSELVLEGEVPDEQRAVVVRPDPRA
ncbi:MAG: hypothetical protein JXQ29_15050, partial [Planctomycetes bacterium]|nr:hypothetical protein [Planctomycetota bacterium]